MTEYDRKTFDKVTSIDLWYLIHHVFLPPKLPKGQDKTENIARGDYVLLTLLKKTASKHVSGASTAEWEKVQGLINAMRELHTFTTIQPGVIQRRLTDLSSGDVIALHIRAQNAGVVIRHKGEALEWELFEVSPSNKSVIECEGRLACSYPGPTISIPRQHAQAPKFISEVAAFLSSMSSTRNDDAMHHVKKAGSWVPEERDTVNPRYITELLTGILRGCQGSQTKPNKQVSKHIRDDVCWDSEYLPWRRSPLWLVVRVALQSTFTDNNSYKLLMAELMAEICSLALAASVDSDTLSVMIRKLGRRAFKISDKMMHPTTLEKVETTLLNVQKTLENRWNQVQRARTRKIPWDSSKASETDTNIILGIKAKSYIEGRLHAYRNATNNTLNSFHPNQRKRYRSLSEFIVATSPFSGTTEQDTLIALFDFEECVRQSVSRGSTAKDIEPLSFDNVSVVRQISELMEAYSCHAPLLYNDNAEANSVYILTLMELWCEMDQAACRATALMKDYPPEIAVELFEPLLFTKMRDMERLQKVEGYLQRRHNASIPNVPKILDESSGKNSFAVRYFDKSPRLRLLCDQIQEEARQAKHEKETELERLNEEYNNLLEEARQLSCTEYWDENEIYIHSHCRKCILTTQADNMYIKTYEWPLPRHENQCKRVVFEVSPDEAFAIWRRTTCHILLEGFKTEGSNKADPAKGFFKDLPELRSKAKPTQRITLAAETKPWFVTHYQVKIDGFTSPTQVCSESAMNYRLYDTQNKEWAADRFEKTTLSPFCKINIKNGPYRGFEYAVNGTKHKSNYVIAKQNSCPRDLTLEEYYAFCSLRSGSKLQWRNILLELGSTALSFKREEVHDLIWAASCQVGSSCASTPLRDDHSDLGDPDVCLEILGIIDKFLEGVKENWQECTAVKTLILIANRILSSNRDGLVTKKALSFLSFAREVTLKWTREIVEKLQDLDDSSDARHERNIIVHMAAVCRRTFDVEPCYQERVLGENLAVYIECGLHINDNRASNYSDLPKPIQTILMQDLRCAVALEPIIHNLLSVCSEPLSECVASLWTRFISERSWQQFNAPNERWYMTKTNTDKSGISQVVHLNILESRLLVAGQPFGKLPTQLVSHPTYQRILKKRVLDIVPSDMKSMTFQTKRNLFGLNLHFAGSGESLYVRAVSEDHKIIHELVPEEILKTEFATPLWKNCSHWLNLDSGELEFRSLNTWWKIEPGDFVLSTGTHGLTLRNNTETMMHLQSGTMDMIAGTLDGIEERAEILVSCNKKESRMKIKVPRYKLEFFCSEGSKEMECQTISDHVVDMDQDIGTLYGLYNMLVLRDKRDLDNTSPRVVIIPQGVTSASQTEACVSRHPSTKITTSGDMRGYYVYKVDTRLGRLVDDGRLSARFTRIHLHALTSHCLPDPLTGKRGTVEALQDLSSAGSFSFRALHSSEFEILGRIASLTPSREYYPEWLKSMETVKFDSNLPTLSQHDGFYPAIELIVQHWAKLEPFCGQQEWTSGLDNMTPALRRRAALRNSNFCEETACNGGSFSYSYDVVYEHRHFPSDKESSVCEISSLVCEWPQRLQMETDLTDLFKSMQSLSRNSTSSYQRLSYSEHWLKLPVRDLWMNLYDLCRHATRQNDMYGLVFVLSALCYSPLNSRASNALVKTLLAFATNIHFSSENLAMPTHDSYPLCEGMSLRGKDIRRVIKKNKNPLGSSNEYSLPRRSGESPKKHRKRLKKSYNKDATAQKESLVSYFTEQWPTRAPSTPSTSDHGYFYVTKMMKRITSLFETWYINKDFYEYLSRVEKELRLMRGSDPRIPTFTNLRGPSLKLELPDIQRRNIGLFDLFNREATKTTVALGMERAKIEDYEIDDEREFIERDRLELVLDQVAGKTGTFGQQYVQHMRSSLYAWRSKATDLIPAKIHIVVEDILGHLGSVSNGAERMLSNLRKKLGPKSKCEVLLLQSGLWPEITPRALLETLQFQKRKHLPVEWQTIILNYGEGLTLVQKAERMLGCLRSGNLGEFQREAENPGQVGWGSIDYPDWLLIELESDMLMRPVQAIIAEEMIQPSEGVNSVMQLNMGEGKSSVILPSISATLADGTVLVRNVVLKPLAGQMFNLLRHKLSGLVNRRIYYLPFSRELDPSIDQIKQLQCIYKECKENGDILLSLPEHILSMKLMGINKSICGSATAEHLLRIQKWVDDNVRDILDESDEILHVKYQMIYTIGAQQLPEGGSDRWTMLKEALNLFRIRALEYHRENSRSVEIIQGGGSGVFPSIRVLTDEAGKDIMKRVEGDIFDGYLPSISTQMRLLSEQGHEDAKSFIRDIRVEKSLADRVKKTSQSSSFYQHLLLLRGLVAHNILLFVFKEKRYRVDYGLDPSRENYNLAVPYRAKDVPATRAELAHIDVLLMLTYLSHYSNGLSNKDIYICFEQLMKSDNPEQTYDDWINVCDNAPPALQKLRGINLEDKLQFANKVCPLLKRNRAVIDFYLATLVFPKQVKEFPEKICANGWDLAEEKPNTSDDKKRYVTGFSGTNDNRYLLPTMMKQQDQDNLLHTNAMVLDHILKPENNTVIHAHQDGERLKAEELLDLVVQQSPVVNVILDVGAQVLELSNDEVIRQWLDRDKRKGIDGGIFFNENDELTVLKNDGSIEAFTGSATMVQQMNKYLVYLDESHTRGTDLKLPPGSRAVVTLGPKLVKDKFVQGCMRMRKLASGHSLVFFAPPEVYHNIIRETKKQHGDKLQTEDVLSWTMLESCKQIEHNFPNWANQGFQYDKRCKGWSEYRRTGNIGNLKVAMLEPERRSLEAMYGPRYDGTSDLTPPEDAHGEMIQQILDVCKSYDIKTLRNVEAEEEQEREVEQEREKERQIERPPDIAAAKHSLHPVIQNFVRTGSIAITANVVYPAFSLFERTSTRHDFHSGAWSRQLLASKDFIETVQLQPHDNIDHYIRPVRWIMSSGSSERKFLLISPYEANELIRDIQKSSHVHLHMYTPRISRSPLISFEDLDICPTPKAAISPMPLIPADISMQLNLFAGQLFLKDYNTYQAVCKFLGLYFDRISADTGNIRRNMDGFLSREERSQLRVDGAAELVFDTSPIKFIEALVSMRRKGMGYISSHMGGIVHARGLREDEF